MGRLMAVMEDSEDSPPYMGPLAQCLASEHSLFVQ